MNGASCFHCGLPVPAGSDWFVDVEGTRRSLCCPGCEAVARTIVDNGLTEYYRTRDGFSGPVDGQSLVPPELALYDAPEGMERYTQPASDAGLREGSFSVEGVRCAACVWLIEQRLRAVPGLRRAELNVATQRLHVQWRDDACKPSDILIAMRAIGYPAYPYDTARHDALLRREEKSLFRRLFIAGLSMMQVMMYAVPAYIAESGTLDDDMAGLMRWASLLLTAPAVFYSAMPFFKGAWANLKSRMLGMDVPVALGIAAAFAGSVDATLRGAGDVYFDSVTMFIFLLLCSRYLELTARRKASSALETLERGLPAMACRLPGFPASRAAEDVPVAALAEGDFVLIRPGEPVPADCVVAEGATAIDVSLLTGESRPVSRAAGESLPGGAVNASQPIVARVARPAKESTLAALIRLVDRAGMGKPRLAQWADKVSAWFVAALLLLALCVFGLWQVIDPARAWPIAIAVLVVSCPCALSLATPSALAAATGTLMKAGVLIVRPHVIETLHRATHVIFDKTGTLTSGRPVLRQTRTHGALGEADALAIAAALEAGSAHPLAAALTEAAGALRGLSALEPQTVAGQGVEGMLNGVRYRLGRAAYVRELAGGACPMPEGEGERAGDTCVHLGSAGGWHATFFLADAVREDARDVVDHFRRQGKTVVLLSGDQPSVTRRVADELGIADAHAEQLPEQKMEFVRDLQSQGAVVAMVGDGINDAAVLRIADVSFAMGGGAMLAVTHADAVLLSGRLASLADAARTAGKAMHVIRQNLAWATLYNALAIPAAALGWLNPWLSGIGMSLSSAIVVVNALRLRRLRQMGQPQRHDAGTTLQGQSWNPSTSSSRLAS